MYDGPECGGDASPDEFYGGGVTPERTVGGAFIVRDDERGSGDGTKSTLCTCVRCKQTDNDRGGYITFKVLSSLKQKKGSWVLLSTYVIREVTRYFTYLLPYCICLTYLSCSSLSPNPFLKDI